MDLSHLFYLMNIYLSTLMRWDVFFEIYYYYIYFKNRFLGMLHDDIIFNIIYLSIFIRNIHLYLLHILNSY